ncbi:AAA family ATPase [soil metagenome]
MNDRPELDEIASLIRSQAPILLVASHEEPRVRALFERACAQLDKALFTWSITDGIRRAGRDDAVYETNELNSALRHIDKTPQDGVYLLCDAHPGFEDPVNCRLIREIALEHHKTSRTLVFLSPSLDEVPTPIARLALRFAPMRPTRDEIHAILSEEAQLWSRQNGEKPKGDRQSIDAMVMHLCGLEQDDVRRLIRQALRADGEINQQDVQQLLRTKHDLLGGDGSLSYEPQTLNFGQVGGLAKLKHWLALRRQPFVDNQGSDRPKGVLLLGVQGGGKSLAARAIAGEWGLPLMRLDFGALYNKFQGETERNVRSAFAAADGMAPCVLWIDEIEKGVSGDSSTSDGGVSRRVLGSFLTWLSERQAPVFVVATANDISELPPELIRKGRFDEIFFVDFPQAASREQILSIHLAKRGHDCAAFDLKALAAACEGYSGAEIEQAIVSAGFESRARGAVGIEQADILAEITRTRPLSVVMAERIGALRHWASTRAVMADEPAAAA